MFVHIGFLIRASHVGFAMDVGITEQEVIVIGRQVVADSGAKEELFEVAGEIVIAVLDFIMPVPSVTEFLVSEVHHPVADGAFLSVHRHWYQEKK